MLESNTHFSCETFPWFIVEGFKAPFDQNSKEQPSSFVLGAIELYVSYFSEYFIYSR